MKKIFLTTLAILCYTLVSSQIIYQEIPSEKLDAPRKIKIQLPRNYDVNTEKEYPIILVLDGDYLFEPVAGNVDYFSYWEDMPEAIVVGILQDATRYDDCSYDDANYLPTGSGAEFFEFIGMELMPYIDEEYRTAKFVVGVGHDFTANFLNYYLFKDPILFNGYINLSPDFAPLMENRILERIPQIEEEVFYYVATGTDDIKTIRKSAENLDSQLKQLDSEKFSYYYDNFEDATHYSLVARGIPNALEKMFTVYRTISQKEFSEVLLKPEVSPYEYLTEKYEIIEDLFGIDDKIRVNDLLAVGTAAEKKQDWESLRDIGSLAQKQHPDKSLGDYFLGRYFEETGNPRKALRTFQGAYNKEEVDYITEDLLLHRADQIKNDFGN